MSDKLNPVIKAAFTEAQVEHLTGVTQRQLRYWDRTGFFKPSLAFEDRSVPLSRLYSFRDLVSLKVLNSLRNDARVGLQELRRVKDCLSHLGDEMWSRTTLYVLKKRVVFVNPANNRMEEVTSGQGVLQIPLKIVQGDMEKSVNSLRKRDDSKIGQIEQVRSIAQNKPVVAGTRIPVKSIKAFSKAGYSIEEIIEQYPLLTEDDVRAALKFEEAA